MSITLEPVAHVRGGRAEAVDDDWGESRCAIELADHIPEAALSGLIDFSHVEVVYVFDRLPEDQVVMDARRPRDNPVWPRIGVFAQRGRNRPNRLGVSICRILGVEARRLIVEGLDAIDGTPVLDIKPVMKGFLPRAEVREPRWAAELMKDYW
ncbi:MAG TPA: SAM-dependent methyltransferase [Caulobacteraceae bacterium]